MFILGILGFVTLDIVSIFVVGRLIHNIPLAFYAVALVALFGINMVAKRLQGVSRGGFADFARSGQDPMATLAARFLPAAGAVLLACPGYLSDLAAIPFFIPACRPWLLGFMKGMMIAVARRAMKKNASAFGGAQGFEDLFKNMSSRPSSRPNSGEKIIDADFEIIDRD